MKFTELINNERHFNDALELLAKKFKPLTYDIDSLNKDAELIGTIKGNVLTVSKEYKHIKKGNYNTFDILLLAYNDNFSLAFNGAKDLLCADLPYIMVGTNVFKKVISKDRYGVERTELTLWNRQTLREREGKDAIYNLPVYDKFIIEPNNLEFNSEISGCYNQYAPFEHSPSISSGSWKWTEVLLRHVFGEQFELGLKYFQVLYLYPKQILPSLVLVSDERETGKSTFVDYLDILFGANMVVINPQDIGSSFNDSYGLKNIIAIEESRFDNTQTLEKLKALATQKKILVNPKGITPYSVPFFGKLVITSNDERKFIRMDEGEIRYWVRKIPTLNGSRNTNILEDLKAEIPHFLMSLSEMEAPDFSRSRMVFTSDEITTESLKGVKEESKPALYKGMYDKFEDIFNNDETLETLEFIPLDVKDRFYLNNNQYDSDYIKRILKEHFKLRPGDNRRYRVLENSDVIKKVGMAYTLERTYFKNVKPIKESNGTPF